jgi:hypothetical protein
MSKFWNAVAQRIGFWGRAMSVGARWTWDVLDKTTRIVAVLALLAVSVGGGLLLHQPAPVIGGVLVALVLLSFAEGAYRVSSEQQRVAAEPDTDALWLSEQLSKGNDLLAEWGDSREVEQRLWPEADAWERETRDGLVARIPEYAGHFGVDVGLGYEFAHFATEVRERTRLRRRIHRLAEIVERYEQGRGT